MAAKIITFIIVLLLNLGGGFVWYFMLALGLNGFTGTDADLSMNLFPVAAIIVSILAAIGSVFATGYLINSKTWNPFLAVAVSAIVFTIVGVVVNFILMFAAIFLAEFFRTNRIKSIKK